MAALAFAVVNDNIDDTRLLIERKEIKINESTKKKKVFTIKKKQLILFDSITKQKMV